MQFGVMKLKCFLKGLFFSCIIHISYCEAENINVSEKEVMGLPNQFEVFSQTHVSNDYGERKLIIRDKVQKKQTELIQDSFLTQMNEFKFFRIGKNKSPYLIVTTVNGPHFGSAYIFNLNKLELGALDVIESYYPFEDVVASSDEAEIYFYGTTLESLENENPVIQMIWKELANE